MDWFCPRIADPAGSPRGGRPRPGERKVLAGIFWSLDNGAKWKDLHREFGTESAVHRFFQHLVREGVFERLLQQAGQLVEERGEYRLYECLLDAAFSPALVEGIGADRERAVAAAVSSALAGGGDDGMPAGRNAWPLRLGRLCMHSEKSPRGFEAYSQMP